MIPVAEYDTQAAIKAVAFYLSQMPEQGDWSWEEHCEGLAGGVIVALYVAGFHVREGRSEPEPEWEPTDEMEASAAHALASCDNREERLTPKSLLLAMHREGLIS